MQLRKQLKWCEITDEENVGRGEIYFRLCRPLPFLDIGPLHADAWFWELGHGSMPVVDFETQRVKLWFCLESEEEKTGFKYVPGSHKNIYDYGGELRGGFIKPTFDEANYDLDIRSLTGGAGKFIIFNDRLLHGGEALYSGTRVSVELTLVIDKNWRKRK